MSVANVVNEMNLAPDVAVDFKTSGVKTDVISESTSATGVTIDSTLLKDGEVDLVDSKAIIFGTGDDVKAEWDGTSFNVAPSTGMWANCPLVNYANGHVIASEFFDDFYSFNEGDTSDWTLDGTGGSVIRGDASALIGVGGYINLIAATTDEDFATLKLSDIDSAVGSWLLADGGKAMWFECRVRPSSTTTCSYMFGLIEAGDTEPIADTSGAENVTDGIYWHTIGGTSTTVLAFSHNLNGTEVDVDATAGTLAATTTITCGFYFDGTTLTPYVNGTAGTTVLAAATNFPVDQGLTPFFAIKTHAVSNAATLSIDYVKIIQMR